MTDAERAEEAEKQLAAAQRRDEIWSRQMAEMERRLSVERTRGDRMEAALRFYMQMCGHTARVTPQTAREMYDFADAALAPMAQAIFDNVVSDPLSDLEKSLTETAYRFGAPTAGEEKP